MLGAADVNTAKEGARDAQISISAVMNLMLFESFIFLVVTAKNSNTIKFQKTHLEAGLKMVHR